MKRTPSSLLAGSFLGAGLLASVLCSSALAQPSAPPPPTQVVETGPTRSASITLSPVHLAIGIVEVTGEFRVAPRLGLAGTLGGGTIDGIGVAEVGAQLNYYLLGDFDGGLHLGAEAQWITAFSDSETNTATMSSAVAEGFAVGPMIGFKWVGDSGLSLVAQAGVQYIAIAAEAKNGSATASREDSKIGPLVNLNAGWSF